jgi:hypothetical protein
MPVALKASARGLVGKSGAGAVKLWLRDRWAILAAAAEIEANVRRAWSKLIPRLPSST